MIGAVTTKVHVKREIILDPITAFENHSKKSLILQQCERSELRLCLYEIH